MARLEARRWAPAVALGIVMSLAGSGTAERAGATAPGENGRIYFRQNGTIFSISPDGADKKKVIPRRKFSDLVEATPAPNGRKLAFASNGDIWTKNLGTGKYKNVTGRASDKLTLVGLESPAWSPNGKKLVFQAVRRQRDRLYRINADGTGIKHLQKFPGVAIHDLTPDWSSTNLIVFQVEGELWTIKPDGSGLAQITSRTELEDRGLNFPSWSPDGTMIAAEVDGSSFADGGVMIVRPNQALGEKYTYLTGDEDNQRSEVIEDPVWSPDGQWVVYYGNWAPTGSSYAEHDLWKVHILDPENPVDINARNEFGDAVFRPHWAPEV